ncbi:DUF389 domain-containing protein [Microvirga roseola]|uniref:DUF389 domain-containing protein n=1 Tax=Microvirga roseola TaxID=2883126 RepID=UPI001E5306AC|nr:DUF389 domain-containing protein [Microvirga roseola]
MSRTIEITIPPEKRQTLIERIQGREGIVGIAVQTGVSLSPPGDIVTVQATNKAVEEILRIIEDLNILESGSFVLSEPAALVAPSQRKAIEHQTNEAAWEEMQSLLRRDTSLTVNFLSLMTLSGAIAAVGLLQDTLHLVIGAMLVAPGFEPLVRIVLGPPSGAWHVSRAGLAATLVGYLMLAFGAAVGLLIAVPLDPTVPADLSNQQWIRYWTSFKWSGAIVAVFGGLAGTVIVNSRRTVFAAGVMIALALVPSMAIAGMALVIGDFPLMLQALARWGMDVACVLLASSLAMTLKRLLMHRRKALF